MVGSPTGTCASDLQFLYSATSSHRLFEFKTCIDPTTFNLKGLQSTIAIFGSTITQSTKMNVFGNIAPPACKVDTLKDGEYVTKVTLYSNANSIIGIDYETSIGEKKTAGKTSGTPTVWTFSDKLLIGMYGSTKDGLITSIGAIIAKPNCLDVIEALTP